MVTILFCWLRCGYEVECYRGWALAASPAFEVELAALHRDVVRWSLQTWGSLNENSSQWEQRMPSPMTKANHPPPLWAKQTSWIWCMLSSLNSVYMAVSQNRLVMMHSWEWGPGVTSTTGHGVPATDSLTHGGYTGQATTEHHCPAVQGRARSENGHAKATSKLTGNSLCCVSACSPRGEGMSKQTRASQSQSCGVFLQQPNPTVKQKETLQSHDSLVYYKQADSCRRASTKNQTADKGLQAARYCRPGTRGQPHHTGYRESWGLPPSHWSWQHQVHTLLASNDILPPQHFSSHGNWGLPVQMAANSGEESNKNSGEAKGICWISWRLSIPSCLVPWTPSPPIEPRDRQVGNETPLNWERHVRTL